MLKNLKMLLLLAMVAIIVVVSYFRETGEASKTGFALDTTISITAKGRNAKENVEKAIQKVHDIEKHITAYSETSDLSTGIVGEYAQKVVERGLYFGEISGGLFDITIKPLVDLWGIASLSPKVPSKEEINEALKRIDYKKVHISGGRLDIPEGMSIDLGGIGKGYAADEAAAVLKSGGIKDGIVDLGGNLVVLGKKKIGIKNPDLNSTNGYMAVVEAENCSVVTSGSYERNFTQDGKTYHHILDPRTGYPSDSGLLSATVISESSMDADAIATIIFIKGAKEGLRFASAMGVQAVAIDKNKSVYTTDGLNIKITDSEYHINSN